MGKHTALLSATWDSKYRRSFEPLVSDFVHIPFGNIEAAKQTITTDTAAVIFEPIQGEGGIRSFTSRMVTVIEGSDWGRGSVADR